MLRYYYKAISEDTAWSTIDPDGPKGHRFAAFFCPVCQADRASISFRFQGGNFAEGVLELSEINRIIFVILLQKFDGLAKGIGGLAEFTLSAKNAPQGLVKAGRFGRDRELSR